MKRIKRFFIILIILAGTLYLLGPGPDKPAMSKDLPSISASIGNIEDYIQKKDAGLPLKQDNGSKLFWADTTRKERTNYCLLYLHGFSASWYEGFPVHVRFAREFGCNLYIPRLASHGLDVEDPLMDMTPDRLWDSAKDALMVARSLGKKVIVMGSSTGGTLALKLASDFPEYVDALLLYSPNIEINNSIAFLLSKPWGLQIGRKSNGGRYRVTEDVLDEKECQYWYCKYRMEGVVYLQQLLDETMSRETFKNITAPVFLGYYFKDKNNQDETVKVSAMLRMFKQLGTLPENKSSVAFPDAGDHVIACELTSGAVDKVMKESIKFAKEIIGMKPLDPKGQ